jgi:predicted site-specific integrase-resolvase
MSTDQQKYSLDNQAALIAAYARNNGYEIVCTYKDAGRSGVTTARRARPKDLLHNVMTSPPFTAVSVVDVSLRGPPSRSRRSGALDTNGAVN